MTTINFGGVEENVVTRDEFPLSKAQAVLKDEIIAIIGYGVQGPAQALNLEDNGISVIVGQAPEFKEDWDRAVRDGFVPGESLFPIEEAAEKATVIQYLVSDAAQRSAELLDVARQCRVLLGRERPPERRRDAQDREEARRAPRHG